MIILYTVITLWLGFGVFIVATTESRGWKADLSFVFTWPINWFLDWRDGL